MRKGPNFVCVSFRSTFSNKDRVIVNNNCPTRVRRKYRNVLDLPLSAVLTIPSRLDLPLWIKYLQDLISIILASSSE